MRKSKDGRKKTGKSSQQRSRKTTSGSGTKSHTSTSKHLEEESKHKGAPSELDQKVALELRPDRRKRDVPPVVVNGILSSATIADTQVDRIVERLQGIELSWEQANRLHSWISPRVRDFSRYPLSVRQANALVDEIEHCWISNQIVTDLIMDLVRWLNQNEM